VGIRPFEKSDLLSVASIHETSFPRQFLSKDWIGCIYGAFPRSRIYVADLDETIVGYVVWTEKSGFRKDAVLELEQIAVAESFRGQGIGKSLIEQSLEMVRDCLKERGSRLKAVMISTRTDNDAQRLYRKVLGAEPVAVIPGIFSADEVLMLGLNKICDDEIQ
jgi:ribosomal protein S18 acetylase RimI-like enzyme